MKRLYVAYGSNLNLEQMKRRCPRAKVYGSGFLVNWQLIFRGSRTGAYATIRRKQGEMVPVVVWEITPLDEYNLDLYEGYPTFYFKQDVMVDMDGGKKKAMVYIMDTSRLPGIPSDYYIETCQQGYLDNGLDMEYLERAIQFNEEECQKAKKVFMPTKKGAR